MNHRADNELNESSCATPLLEVPTGMLLQS